MRNLKLKSSNWRLTRKIKLENKMVNDCGDRISRGHTSSLPPMMRNDFVCQSSRYDNVLTDL